MKAGLLTGLGSSAADCLYACVGVFGLTLISDFLLRHQKMINFVGGCLIRLFISSFAIGITNPAAILTFLFAFSWFGIEGQSGPAEGIGLVAGVFLGTFCWWSVISGTVILLEKKAKNKRLSIMNKGFGIILVLFGAVVLSGNILN